MVIFSLCLLLFINSMSIGLVFPIFAPLFTQGHAPFFAATTSLATQNFFYTMILAVPTFCMVFGAPFWGRMSDRIGRKRVLLIGLFGVTCSFFLSAFGVSEGSLFVLFLSRIVAGFMDGSEAVAQTAISDISEPNKKVRNMGFATFAGTIGFIVGPILGGFLADPAITGIHHYQIPFFVSAVLSLINLAILYIWLPASPTVHLTPEEQTSYLSLLLKGCSFCFDKRIRLYSVLFFVVHFSMAIFYQLSSLLLSETFHYGSAQLGLFTTFLGACFSVSIFFCVHVLVKKYNHINLLKTGLFLLAFSTLVGLYFHTSYLFAWVTVVPLMLGIAMMYNILLVFMLNAVSEQEQGEAMGTGTSLKAIAWLISGFVVSGLFPNMVAVLFIMLAVVLISFVQLKRKVFT